THRSTTTPDPTRICTLSLHDALPISVDSRPQDGGVDRLGQELIHTGSETLRPIFLPRTRRQGNDGQMPAGRALALPNCLNHLERSEEHTSELQSRGHLVCRHLPEKKK